MIIRNANYDDMNSILDIYVIARDTMKNSGNPTQWGDNWPSVEILNEDIKNNQLYVIVDNDEIVGVFVMFEGPDKMYNKIDDGKWLNNDTYGVIHRIASNNKIKNILKTAIEFCENKFPNVRIDTHENNKIMQHLLDKYGYVKCGIVYAPDGTERIAYQKIVNNY